jgi:carbamoyltransferase
MAAYAQRLTGMKKLCLAGGVALNCVANGRLLREGPFDDIWIQPAAGDSGCALGAALDAYHTSLNQPRVLRPDGRPAQGGSFFGPSFSDEEIEGFLRTNGYPFRKLNPEDRGKILAEVLAAGKVLGHFAGRMEFGPRALGSRSIMGDPRNTEMQATLNLKIKYRESFRPFAPVVKAEKVGEYFELDRESPYMLLVAGVKKERRLPFELPDNDDDMLKIVKQPRSDLPAITHVDYSARVQSVHREDHPEYYDLIDGFDRLTGCAVVVNTSFNVRGEPIVCTPQDAYRCFMRTKMDVLALGNFLLLKSEQPAWPEPKGHIDEDREPAAEYDDEPFMTELRRIYREEFVELSDRLRKRGLVAVDTGWTGPQNFRGGFRGWGVAADQSPHTIFAVPHALDEADPDPRRMVDAILRQWTPGEATEAMRPLLERLVRLGLNKPAKAGVALEEDVSDAVYVMY